MDDFKGVLCNMAYSVESGQPFSLDIIWAPLLAWSLFGSRETGGIQLAVQYRCAKDV
jgi:hypothetical protein